MPTAASKPQDMLRVLVFFSAGDALRTDQEQKAIAVETQAAKAAGTLEVEMWTATTKSDVFEKITKFDPHILHFAGHGNASGNLMLEGQPFAVENLATTLTETGRRFRMLILAACNIGHHAQNFRPSFDFVVGCAGALDDKAAIGFACGFYRELCRKIADWRVDKTLKECVSAGHGEGKVAMAGAYSEAASLKLLHQPSLGKTLRPIKPQDHDAKCKVFFGDTTQLLCAVSGTMAEVGGMLSSLSSEMDIHELVQRIQRLCTQLSSGTKLPAPPPIHVRSPAEQPDGIVGNPAGMVIASLETELSSLMTTADRWSKIAGIVLSQTDTSGVSIAGLKTALNCKLKEYRDGEGAVSEFCERISNMQTLLGEYYRAAPQAVERGSVWYRLCDDAGRLSSASSRLLDHLNKCISDRFTGGFNATRRFGRKTVITDAVAEFIDLLPHHQEGDRPGPTLWQHVEKEQIA